jgi:orotidine-5'-phosphate decarboxylase
MTKPLASEYPKLKATDRIIAALDVATAEEAHSIVNELKDHVGAFKIGSQLFTAAGPSLVREFAASGVKIFLDLKFHDIPNTVANAAVEAARLGVWMINVHALGGRQMMRQTVDDVRSVCEREKLTRPLIIGVTVLTSSSEAELRETGIDNDLAAEVVRLARLAAGCGLDGVVASAHESKLIRQAVERTDFLIVTPGIRPKAATNDDQKRVTTFTKAIEGGSDMVVIGRPLLQASDRRGFIIELTSELDPVK